MKVFKIMLKNNKLNILIIVVSLLIFILIGLNYSELQLISHAEQQCLYFVKLVPDSWIPFVVFITKFGYEFVNFLLLFLAVFLSVLRKFNELLLLSLSTAGGYILAGALKPLFQIERPDVSQITEYNAIGYGFPSGHAVLAVCFWGVFIYLAFRYIDNKWLKYPLISFVVVLILLIGLSRLILGVHYPLDILGGYFIGLFWLGVCVLVYRILVIYYKFIFR